MEDKLVTLAILTYAKAQILKNVLEAEGIEAYIHNVNLIQPVISSGVRVRIKESDLPHALQIIESSTWLAEDIVKEQEESNKERNKQKKVLIPVDFSDYSLKACQFGFSFAKSINAQEVNPENTKKIKANATCLFQSYLCSHNPLWNRKFQLSNRKRRLYKEYDRNSS